VRAPEALIFRDGVGLFLGARCVLVVFDFEGVSEVNGFLPDNDEDGVVLGAARQGLNDAADLVAPVR
jgi:hypothetical protein